MSSTQSQVDCNFNAAPRTRRKIIQGPSSLPCHYSPSAPLGLSRLELVVTGHWPLLLRHLRSVPTLSRGNAFPTLQHGFSSLSLRLCLPQPFHFGSDILSHLCSHLSIPESTTPTHLRQCVNKNHDLSNGQTFRRYRHYLSFFPRPSLINTATATLRTISDFSAPPESGYLSCVDLLLELQSLGYPSRFLQRILHARASADRSSTLWPRLLQLSECAPAIFGGI
jgi:hypothetical protein